MLADAQLRGEYRGGLWVGVSQKEHSLHIGYADSEEKRERRTPPSGADVDDVEVVPPPAEPQ